MLRDTGTQVTVAVLKPGGSISMPALEVMHQTEAEEDEDLQEDAFATAWPMRAEICQ